MRASVLGARRRRYNCLNIEKSGNACLNAAERGGTGGLFPHGSAAAGSQLRHIRGSLEVKEFWPLLRAAGSSALSRSAIK